MAEAKLSDEPGMVPLGMSVSLGGFCVVISWELTRIGPAFTTGVCSCLRAFLKSCLLFKVGVPGRRLRTDSFGVGVTEEGDLDGDGVLTLVFASISSCCLLSAKGTGGDSFITSLGCDSS